MHGAAVKTCGKDLNEGILRPQKVVLWKERWRNFMLCTLLPAKFLSSSMRLISA